MIGTGGISRGVHMPFWHKSPEVEIAAVMDVHGPSAEEVAAQYGVSHVFTNVEEMLEKVKPDIVDVCTPNLAHTPQVLAALEAGAHVLCEKPLAVTTAEVRRKLRRLMPSGAGLAGCCAALFISMPRLCERSCYSRTTQRMRAGCGFASGEFG